MAEHNLPLNWELVQPIIEEYATARDMVFHYEQFGGKIAVKILKPGSPIRIDLFQTKTGMTIVSNLGRDQEANQLLVDYIEESIGYGRLHEDRVTFRNVSMDTQMTIKKLIQEYSVRNEVSITLESGLDRMELKDSLISNTVKISFYSNGTIFMYGFNTPLFDEIHNLIYSQTGVLPTVQYQLLNSVVHFAKESIDKDDLKECHSCEHLGRCSSNGIKMLNMAHFERSISTYPCQRVTNTYVCRYMHRYSSEISNLVEFNKDYINGLDKVKILSLGCGASPDFLAFKYHLENKKIEYIGIDYNKQWSQFHEFYKGMNNDRCDLKYYYLDFFEIIDRLNKDNKMLDFNIVVMSYVISTISVNHDIEGIVNLFKKIDQRILKYMQPGSLFIINDINNKEHFVDIVDTIIKKIDLSDFEVNKYFHNGSNRRYMSEGKAIKNPMIRYYLNKEIITEYNSQLECNSAAYILRRKP